MRNAYGTVWQKSSYSPNGNNCVELATSADGGTHVRESDDPTVVLTTTPARLHALLTLARKRRLVS